MLPGNCSFLLSQIKSSGAPNRTDANYTKALWSFRPSESREETENRRSAYPLPLPCTPYTWVRHGRLTALTDTPPCGPAPTICCTGCCCCSCCCGCCLPLEVEPPLPSTKFHARNKVETKLKIVKDILHWLGFLHLIKGVFPYLRKQHQVG